MLIRQLSSSINFYWTYIFLILYTNWALMLKCFIYKKKLGVIVGFTDRVKM